MSFPRELDGARLHDWATRAVAELSARRAEINELNVFPVPDSDTGSNMAHTMEAALAEVEKLDDFNEVGKVARALSAGSVRGARGNSGLVLSQVLRGVADATDSEVIGPKDIAQALSTAVQLVDRAISAPVEGTIITVLRAAAVAAQATQATNGQLHEVVTEAVIASRTALAKTPSQLDILREAGVVDAGGAGFVVLLEALLAEIEGDDVPSPVTSEHHGHAVELEVVFFFIGDLITLQERIELLGGSLIIARNDENSGSVHIHTTLAGKVIETAFATGQVSGLHLEVLPSAPQVDAPRRVVVAVTPEGSVANLYQQAGAMVVNPGPDVVSDILGLVRHISAQELIMLPNGLLDRRQLVAVERATHAFEQAITIVPTRRLVSGLAALTVHDPNAPLGVAAYTMAEAAAAMHTAIVTKDDVKTTVQAATEKICAGLVGDATEQVILLSGTELDVDKLDQQLDVEVLVFPADGLGHLVEIGVE
ncbi:DAK2 domain-containing protein [Corynebacterium alimapuense]|uniref:Kinase n=1 Tax=Corynebacterium alimapuense TaxID=1576874 RepID=A0A3M8K525_9CORY|nr:DAK2 domain-containing protein [Corynebacterium alimapuense]RNE48323.1 kinase [Corynebacterium alimapuense]